MLGLDQNGVYLVAALLITVLVLGGYTLYVRSRLTAARRRKAHAEQDEVQQAADARPVLT
jgi:hypothetical protein